jgi:hypothetical protein
MTCRAATSRKAAKPRDKLAKVASLAKAINHRLQLETSAANRASPWTADDRIWSLSVHGPRESEPSERVLPPGQLRRKE